MTKQKSIAHNTILLYFRTFITMIVGLYTSRVILQALGETDYGVYNVVGGIVGMLSFLNASLSGASSRFLTNAIGQNNQELTNLTFSASLNIQICLSIIIVIFGEIGGLWLLYNKLVIPADKMFAAFWVLQFSIVTSVFSITSVPYNASLISHENMSMYAYMGLYDAFVKLGIAFIIDFLDSEKLFIYGLLLMLNGIASRMIYQIYAIRHYPECRFRWVADKRIYKELTGYSIWDMIGNVSVICQNQGVNVLLNIFFGPIANTARAISYQVMAGVTAFVGGFTTASRPRVIKYYAQGKIQDMYKLTFETAKITYFLVYMLALPVLLELRFLLHLWLGNDVPYLTYSFTTVVIFIALAETFHTAYLMAFHAIGKIKTGNNICGSLRILALPLGYLTLKLGMPALSIFIIFLFTNIICHIISWIIIYRYEKFDVATLISTVYLPCLLVSAVTLVIPGIIFFSMSDNLLRFFYISISFIMIFIPCTYFLGFTRNERKLYIKPFLTGMVKKFRRA